MITPKRTPSKARDYSRQPHRAESKAGENPPEGALKLRRSGTTLRGFSGVLLGLVLIALGPAL